MVKLARGKRRRVAVLGVLAGMTMAFLPPLADGARAESVKPHATSLPKPLSQSAAVWDGTHAYLLGGFVPGEGPSDRIYRFDPSTGAVTAMEARLPSGRYYASAIWADDAAYLFGGTSEAGSLADISEIVRYDPASDTATVVGALPTGLAGSSAVWDGTHAYIFGGRLPAGAPSDQILSFDPQTNTTTILLSRLPSPRQAVTAISDGTRAYLFGGFGFSFLDEVVAFDPGTGSVEVVGRLPTPRRYASAVWAGDQAYVFGGDTANGLTDQVVRFVPSEEQVSVMGAFLPLKNAQTSAIWDGSAGFIFGGTSQGASISRFDPRGPSVPVGVSAVPGPDYGEITLHWGPPTNEGAGIVGYRIYRGADSGEMSLFKEMGPGETFEDSGMPWSSTRYYRIAAVDADGVEGQISREVVATTLPEPPSPIGLNRWHGVEGGISCLSGATCQDFSQVGTVYGVESGSEIEDPDGVVREWPARTGRRFALPAVLDRNSGSPFPGRLISTTPFPGGTVSFAMRIHTLPLQPLVFYEHAGSLPGTTVRLTLTPTGNVMATHSGTQLGVTTGRLETERWHTLGMSYGLSSQTFRLYLDETREIEASMPDQGPTGTVSIGVVQPVTFFYQFGLDDYVEAASLNAPILGARIGYLIPHGNGGRSEWSKPSGQGPDLDACIEVADNWQLVSEDATVKAGNIGCTVSGIGVRASETATMDEYLTEGIPSIHEPSQEYARIGDQPGPGDSILAVRPRVFAAAPFKVEVSILDGPDRIVDPIGWKGETAQQQWWAPADRLGHAWRPDGTPWTVGDLGAARLRLEHADKQGKPTWVAGIRLDYVWVPD